ncbi:MAG: helix-turn-helix transcriptional regulator [Bacteroidota bacterium]
MVSLTMKELAILAALETDRLYGLEIVREVNQHNFVSIQLGRLYSILSGMEKKGVLKSEEGSSTSKRGGNKRRYYSITGAGQDCLDQYRSGLAGTLGFQLV